MSVCPCSPTPANAQPRKDLFNVTSRAGFQEVKRPFESTSRAENIFKPGLTHHNLISELVRHFSCRRTSQRKDSRKAFIPNHPSVLNERQSVGILSPTEILFYSSHLKFYSNWLFGEIVFVMRVFFSPFFFRPKSQTQHNHEDVAEQLTGRIKIFYL